MCKMHEVRFIKGIKISESMFNRQNLPSLLTKQLSISGDTFCIFGKVNFNGIRTSRQLTCLYIGPSIFLFTFGLKYPNKLNLLCIL